MNTTIDWSKVIPIKMMNGEDDEDSLLLQQMLTEAENYLRSYRWCREIKDTFWGIGIGGVVAVFLFHIKPELPCTDDYVWVIVGDIPPLYITVDDAPNPACALKGYIGAMKAWATAAMKGDTVEDLAPVYAAATKKNGIALKKRLEFLDREILVNYKADLNSVKI